MASPETEHERAFRLAQQWSELASALENVRETDLARLLWAAGSLVTKPDGTRALAREVEEVFTRLQLEPPDGDDLAQIEQAISALMNAVLGEQ